VANRRRRAPMGIKSKEELLIHRELEFLRVAGRRAPRRAVLARWRKLEQARRLSAKVALWPSCLLGQYARN
jgi:hypothetical protein